VSLLDRITGHHHGVALSDAVADFSLGCVSRALDDREITLRQQSRVFFQISGAGHEALGLGLARELRAGYDWFFPYYRDRALVLGLGVSPLEMANAYATLAARVYLAAVLLAALAALSALNASLAGAGCTEPGDGAAVRKSIRQAMQCDLKVLRAGPGTTCTFPTLHDAPVFPYEQFMIQADDTRKSGCHDPVGMVFLSNRGSMPSRIASR
jgi:uncharacterized membrane protein